MLNVALPPMTSAPTDPSDDLIEYIWSLARMCYVAQAALWKLEGRALEAKDTELADRLRDYQIALYSSSVQINAAETVIRAQTEPDVALKPALLSAERDVRDALGKLDDLDTAADGAEAVVNALAELETVTREM